LEKKYEKLKVGFELFRGKNNEEENEIVGEFKVDLKISILSFDFFKKGFYIFF